MPLKVNHTAVKLKNEGANKSTSAQSQRKDKNADSTESTSSHQTQAKPLIHRTKICDTRSGKTTRCNNEIK